MKKVLIGEVAQFNTWPTTLEIDGQPFFLVRENDSIQLLSSTCPHMGGTICHTDGVFECPVHMWKFDEKSGKCLTNKNQSMKPIDTIIEDGMIFALLESEEEETSVKKSTNQIPVDLSIKLHSHACLEFETDNFRLLTDPWLDGPCFLGAWTHYPTPLTNGSDLRPDAIWISHEHSDHFHEPTLAHFNKEIPVYVPDFPNQRLKHRLRALGFSRVHAMPFGEKIQIADQIFITCYEPISLWNDAIVLIEIKGFRFLNLNDAGLNPHIARQVGPVDAIASAFSPGASGFPLTWGHLSEDEKSTIMRKSCSGLLTMLENAASLYQTKNIIPFASHFELWNPEHEPFVHKSLKNSLDDVLKYFENKPIRVVDLLAGEKWIPESDEIERIGYNRRELYDPINKHLWLKNQFDQEIFMKSYPTAIDISRQEVISYLLKLNEVPEIIFSEDVEVLLTSTGKMPGLAFDVSFRIANGELTIEEVGLKRTGITISMPNEILGSIVQKDISWDEAFIGYWCSFYRDSDIYHADFWRLLQAPYYRKNPRINRLSQLNAKNDINKMTIADLFDRYGDDVERILGRYGLYCMGCYRSNQETLELALLSHGILQEKKERLYQELDVLFVE
ncbi:Rieske 2Fe-2S domain-containing protein [Paenibacillus sp. 2TAB23]|uniref:Rieske 2Fe-2S domain-containing protein n=1 Tax=Paenibacillus sp. 2TAB23 TaxID=3233004 RepID=UPI003F95DE7D